MKKESPSGHAGKGSSGRELQVWRCEGKTWPGLVGQRLLNQSGPPFAAQREHGVLNWDLSGCMSFTKSHTKRQIPDLFPHPALSSPSVLLLGWRVGPASGKYLCWIIWRQHKIYRYFHKSFMVYAACYLPLSAEKERKILKKMGWNEQREMTWEFYWKSLLQRRGTWAQAELGDRRHSGSADSALYIQPALQSPKHFHSHQLLKASQKSN